MKQIWKLGWLVASVAAAALLFAGCPTRPDDDPTPMPPGDGAVFIFSDGALGAGAALVAHEEAGLHAQVTGGNIAAQWNPADYGGSGAIRVNIDFDPPVDISGFTDLLVEWAVPSTYSANMTIVLGFDGDDNYILMMFKHAQNSDHFNFAGGRDTAVWVGNFANSSQLLTSLEIFSPDASNFGGGTTLNISQIAIVGGDAPGSGGDNNNGGGDIVPPPTGTALTVDVAGTSVNATIAQGSRDVAGVDGNGNLVVSWNSADEGGAFRVDVSFGAPVDISELSNFVMDWSGEGYASINISLHFTDGWTMLHDGGAPPGRTSFHFVDNWPSWGAGWLPEFEDTSKLLTRFEIFSGSSDVGDVLTISLIAFE